MNGNKTLKELAMDGMTTNDRTPGQSSISLAKDVHMETNNKGRAGDSRKETVKRSGLSMEYKSKSFAASFRKSADEDDIDYDYGNISSDSSLSHIPEGTKRIPKDAKTTPLKTVTAGEDGSGDFAVDGSNKNMDCLKNTGAKASTKAAEISAKTSWVKDRVYNFWSKKGKQEEMDKDLNKKETEMSMTENVGEILAEEKTPVKKSPSHENIKSQEGEHDEDIPAVDFKEGSKERKQTRGWIRDQVSSLISKGKNYASSGASNADVDSEEMKSIEMKNPELLSQKLSEHYSLKQTCDGNDEELQMKFDDIPKIEEPKIEKEKFLDIHQNISRKISQQTAVVLTKEELSTPQVGEVSISPKGTPKSGGSKKTSAKLKIKGFLNSRPLATELTHLPLASSPSEKEEKEKTSLSAQTKKKFKFASKLSFSELLHSQEHGTQPSPEDDSRNSNAASPVFSKIEEPLSEEEDDLKKIVMPEDGSPYHSMKKRESSVTFVKIWSLAVLFYALYIIPISAFFNGLILGALVMYLVGCLVIWLFCPSGKSIEQYKEELKHYLKEQDSSTVKKSIRSVDPNALKKPRDIKGWVHFLIDYDPGFFSLDMTKDVYAVLKGATLHILYCKPQPENKPVMPQKLKRVRRGLRARRKQKTELNENQQPVFIFEKEHKISLSQCELSLQPLDLPMRRIWNRKYPIRIEIPPNAMLVRDIDVPFEELTANFDEFFNNDNNDEWTASTEEERLHIFPITSREKEDWFYRMQLCSKPLKHQVTLDDVKKGHLSTSAAESYPHYMVECIRESEKITTRIINGKRLEPHSAWLNVLLGRAFWDVWHEPYWKRKVWQKIQSRLTKLNTPPIIKEIYVKDLHLGHTLPIIHKGSLPELDEYGVWSDLQVTYQGEFTLTLETQLNVDYYITLLTKIAKQQTQTQDSPNTDVRMKVVRDKNNGDIVDNGASSETSCDAADFDGETMLPEQLPEIFLEAIDQVDVDEEDLGAVLDDDPMTSDPRTKAFLESKTGKRVVGIVGWLARSKIAKKVAETDFAKKAYEKAYEKFRKMPIILKVTVQSLKGTLAVNIAPPPTNRLWFGFRGNPAVLLTAHPKLGDRHVRLTYLTDWIERKLKDEFKKLFVLPSMQDISVKLMYSRLEELYADRPLS